MWERDQQENRHFFISVESFRKGWGWRVVLNVLHTEGTALTGSGNEGVILNQFTEVSGGYFLMYKDRERPSCRL